MGKRQNQGHRCYIVQQFLLKIEDDAERLICYLYLRNQTDRQVCKQLKIKRKQLNLIKCKLAMELKQAGIRY